MTAYELILATKDYFNGNMKRTHEAITELIEEINAKSNIYEERLRQSLYSAIQHYSENDKVETDEQFENLIRIIVDQENLFATVLSSELEEFMLDKGHCPKCGECIEEESSYMEDRGEYQGVAVQERIRNYSCPSCGERVA